ncbi:SDR family oxidoreductase [Halioxenophilus sp. WMMB6]|uniref:SDR family oxidoreductase n=1 Tax=Halioxenophilus sp. WMMB6 TaxID=3073815 RepID=UPI00295EFD85|nr:SDR family oxidoreductase [Halioxenophilus sp. WMMB6]
MNNKNSAGTLLITGATGGMGSASALLAAEQGYDLWLTDLNEAKLKTLAEACTALGGSCRYSVLDISDAAAVNQFFKELESAPELAGVIHAVGLSPHMADWQQMVQVDLVSTIDLLEKLSARIAPGGAAVAISSMSGHMIPPNPEIDALLAEPLLPDLLSRLAALPEQPLTNSGIAYAYAKRALTNYVKNHAFTWGRRGKRLVSLSPGLIDTPMGQLEAEADKENYAGMRKLIALQRDGLPVEIANAALFLVSKQASYITGCDLLVDGGFVAALAMMQAQKSQA